jgi:PAS domain S-box-containing protein
VEENQDEDELLRSVALQNANSILLARQRAEQELLQAKEALELRTEELARSLAMLRATLESTTDGILVTDGDGKVTSFNEKYVAMWRLSREITDSRDHRQLLETICRQFEDPRRFLAKIEDIYASSPPESHDLLELADGRTFERFSRIQFMEGRNAGRVWSFRDITVRRRAEDALQQQSEWLRITLSSIGDAIISTDAEGRVTFLNGVAESLTGWNQAETLGRPLPDIFHIINYQTRLPVENPALDALREGKTMGLANHTVLVAKDGTERPIDDSAAPMRDGSGATIGAVLVFRDVTERMRAAEVQARLAAIVESSDDAIISKTLEGIILSWNTGAERLFGYTASEAVGRSILLIIPPEREDEEREVLERLRRGERVEHFETVRVTKQGRRIDISLTVSPIRDSSGRVIGASKNARDITDWKRVQEALREAARRKDEFLALLAHELRNPLAPLRNGLEVIRLAAGDAHTVTQARAMMERQLGHMVRLVDDLLDISRISRNKMELRRARVLLTDVLSSAVETARPVIEAAGHELIISLPPEPVHLDADLTRLAQVFGNLLTNSAKYTERGGRIWLAAEPRCGEVVVSVRDNGIGIPADALPHIFDIFSQVDRSLERSTGGLGIGLALVKGLVEMHGGAVTAESGGLGKGSLFTVRLPTPESRTEPVTSEMPEGGPAENGPKRRILVTDDNRDSASSMATILKLLGNEVCIAHDGVEAVETAERYQPEVVLMDVGMPRLNGYEATRRIREQPWGQDMVIIALTGWGQEGDKARSQEAGCDGHLVKPINLSDLEKLLAELTSRDSSSEAGPTR